MRAEVWQEFGARPDSCNNPPVISIVTATLNAAAFLPHTLESLARQRGASFEWIVADGGSTDGTLELLRAHAGLVQWTSAPDRGIYDAWNKACDRARGDWLLFLGAGDDLVGPEALAAFAEPLAQAHPAHDLVYGRLRYLSPRDRVELEEVGAPWPELRGRWEIGRPALPAHPATFHHRSLFAGGRRFDTRFQLAADSHFLLRHALSKPPLYVPVPLVRVPLGGVSFKLGSAAALAREIAQLDRELGLVPPLRHRLAERVRLAAKIVASGLPTPLGHAVADLGRVLSGQPRRWGIR
jgi:glycosyltransferase involved in cell wall biosynthesis